jgi:ABC-2 type transport system ATP-binding protein
VGTRWGVGALVAVLVAGGAVAVAASGGDPAPARTESLRIEGAPEPDGSAVSLDSRLYLPARTPAPAVLLAHGYGGTLDSVAGQARQLAGRGYVVLTWSARGFGASGGRVHLDSPDYEVKDGALLLDRLARRPEVRQDGTGDPRVAVVGASYGGALALMLAGTDRRVDAVVPSITWNDLRQALFPQFATTPGAPTPAGLRPTGGVGVFKKQWTALLFGASAAGSGSLTGAGPLAGASTACGRLSADLCLGYVRTATTGRPTVGLLNLLAASSPARVVSRITAPTLLIQGQTDSLFPLSEADANARAIASAGTEVQVVWEAGGHDADAGETDRLRSITADFLDRTLSRRSDPGPGPVRAGADPAFRVTVPDAAVSLSNADPAPQARSAPALPGLTGGAVRRVSLPLAGGGLALSPPGGAPAALTSLPGVSGALGLLGGVAGRGSLGGGAPGAGAGGSGSGSGFGLGVLPGQAVTFDTGPLEREISVVGSSTVRLRVLSSAGDATLFASLLDVAPDGGTTLPQQLVSPVRVEAAAGSARDVTVALPAIVLDVPAGHRLRVVVASTDQGYAVPAEPRGYQISLAGDSALAVPQVPMSVDGSGSAGRLWAAAVAIAVLALLTVAGFALPQRRRRRRTTSDVVPGLLDVPLAISGLGKAYGDGFRAVSDLSFRVETGQVLGLLGPNGAGKTTTLRMAVGLIHPTEGEVRIFGHRVTPGAPVLSRLGSFIEGPGFLPHLSGLDNLELYWRATGRPAESAQLPLALEIAGLGDDVRRKVRTYSQGMRQRLAIAQAMLGLPELLVLDEPTNGLDPPQIHQMRSVLARYAETGRTVLVSSHLLAEVEQTCTHVVVMANGRLVAQGPVEELIGAGTSRLSEIDVDDPPVAAAIATRTEGVDDVKVTANGLVVRADAAARGRLVAELVGAGLRVERVAPRRGLEETFLALIGEAG